MRTPFVFMLTALSIAPWTKGADAPTTSPTTQAIKVPRTATDAVRKLSDDELRRALDGSDDGLDLCLNEVVRRGGTEWERTLLARADRKIKGNDEASWRLRESQLEYLTALRRLQGKPDPTLILVEGKLELECRLGYLTGFEVNLTNLDTDKAEVRFDSGGDYRGSNRRNKWRIQVVDGHGHVLPEKEDCDMGGFSHELELEYGESLPATLRLADYVQIDAPGDYSATVIYHPRLHIACMENADGLICAHSLPIKLIVKPIEIETTDGEQAQLLDLVLHLPNKGPVKILGGAADKPTAEAFYPKESGAAQLKLAGWKAVPPLIRGATGSRLTPVQRAWALGLLFSITDRNDPMEAGRIIGPFKYQHTGWVSFGGPEHGAAVSTRSAEVLVGEIDPAAQTRFAATWKPWLERGYITFKKQ